MGNINKNEFHSSSVKLAIEWFCIEPD